MSKRNTEHHGLSKMLVLLVLSSGIGYHYGDGRLPLVTPDADNVCTSPAPAPAPWSPLALEAPMAADYIVTTGPGLVYNMNGVQNGPITLTRGQTYTFDLTAVSGQHPFVINSNQNDASGTQYTTPSSGTTISFTPDFVMPATIYYHCMVHFSVMHATVTLVSPVIRVSVKAFLEGAYDGPTGKMRDDLRAAAIIPPNEPYTTLGYTYVGTSGGSVLPAVLAVAGDNAIVDWVIIELRDNTTPHTIVASKAALIQRDGDVVGTDGVSPVQFSLATGMYRVTLRHRTHLGVMTLNGVSLSSSPTSVDFTSPATACFGTSPLNTVSGVQVLWMGDANFDGSLLYTGANNDRDPILVTVGGTTPNNSAAGYLGTDLNMNGSVLYTGSGNDRDPILVNIGSTTPNNTRLQQLP